MYEIKYFNLGMSTLKIQKGLINPVLKKGIDFPPHLE